MKDTLGDRIKSNYEDRFRTYLPRRSYTIIRIDGKSFHSYTKGLNKPFDDGLIEDMNETTKYLCENIMGAKFGYVQSDEISILITDFNDINTQAWFDNNLQKMCSISASLATAKFNALRIARFANSVNAWGQDLNKYFSQKLAHFDSRVFQIPQKTEVANYFQWRQQDATRNSISSVAQSLYPHKELHGKKTDEMQEMIFQKGINWNDYDSGKKRGRFIEKVTYVNGKNIKLFPLEVISEDDIVRNKWEVVECPIFTQDKEFLYNRVPDNN